MDWLRIIALSFFLLIGKIPTVTSKCASPFLNGDEDEFCYRWEKTAVPWSEGLNRCLDASINGLLIQINSIKQFHSLRAIESSGKPLWLGANNFALASTAKWLWIDGSVVDSTVVTWCSNSTYDVAIGTQCAAYEPNSQCVTNYPCSTALPAPCIAKSVALQWRSSLNSRAITTATCTNSYGGAYANWWVYAALLINWFLLFCFVLYLTNRLNLNKRTVIITACVVLISFMVIIAFAILWGVQYQDLVFIPLIVAILGCVASLLFLIDIFILMLHHNQIQRSMLCVITTIVIFAIEVGLMIGLILCIAHCSGYVTFGSTRVDKDVIAALLASINVAISIIFYNLILFLIGHANQDRVRVVQSNDPAQNAGVPLTTDIAAGMQAMVPRRSVNNNVGRKYGQVERATSPVDQRIINEFYGDASKDIHKYKLDGRQYVVYEGKTFTDIDPIRKDLTEAMLLQERQGLHDAIDRAKNSPHAPSLTQEIQQAEDLLSRLQ